MKQIEQKRFEPVDASPVKAFFVSMLTRDIKLEEAILDLLDNSVDGVLRSRDRVNTRKPYDGFWAEITFNKDSFSISDNCGGIPWGLHEYAFRMGRMSHRPADKAGTVGVYGIGMKRAIFKMGEHCLISTQNGTEGYEIEITPEWIKDEKEWHIPVTVAKRTMKEDGTTIYVGNLRSGIDTRFDENSESFSADLKRMIATHYAFIIDKGFKVKVNGSTVEPYPTKLVYSEKRGGIKPFVFKTTTKDNVEVFLTVGFTRPIPSQDEVNNAQEEVRYSSLDAGWTVLCNDRAVLYCDRTEMTGWGEAGIPRYHTQFIAITGIVEFKSADASKLPTTTTKRGIDASSALYLQIKNKMREGMRIFVNYTNKWKGLPEESKKQIEEGKRLSFEEIKTETKNLVFTSTRSSIPPGDQFKPVLPLPKRPEPCNRRISYLRDVDDVKIVSDFLFHNEDEDPSVVGG